jgi:hypothetical protein
MFIKRIIPAILSGLLLVSPLALAGETADQAPQAGAGIGSAGEATDTAKSPETPSNAEEVTDGSGMVSGQGNSGNAGGMAIRPGMGGPGKPWCHMGRGGMKGMMQGGGMGKGGMKCGCQAHHGITQQQFRELDGRLKVLDARMAKIEVMLERLLEE